MEEVKKREWQEGWYEIGQHLVHNMIHSLSFAINELRIEISQKTASGDQLKFFDYIYPSISKRLTELEDRVLKMESRLTLFVEGGNTIMPLVKGKKASSRKGFSKNVEREMHEGKPQKQAVAIAYSEARHGKKKAKKK